MSGCADATSARGPRDARAAGGTPTYHPVALREFAFGRPQAGVSGSARATHAELESYLLPSALPKTRVKSDLGRTRALPPSNTEKSAAAQPVSPSPAATPAPAAPSQPLASNDTPIAQRYAARDARAQAQQEYRGGDVLVITASTLVIVLLIVLLVVLLLK